MPADSLTAADLRAWREARGLTQQQLGDLTGYSERAVRAMEAGARPVSRPMAVAVSQLDVPEEGA